MALSRRLGLAAILAAAACGGGHDKTPTAPTPVVPFTSTIDRADGFGGDTGTVTVTGDNSTVYRLKGNQVSTGPSFKYHFTLPVGDDTLEARAADGRVKYVILHGEKLPESTIAASNAVTETKVGGADVPVTITLPAGLTSSTFTHGGKQESAFSGTKTFFAASDPDSTKTRTETYTVQGTIPGYNGQKRDLAPKTVDVVVRAGVPQNSITQGNYGLAGYPGLVLVMRDQNSGTPGTNVLHLMNGSTTYADTNGVASFTYAPITPVESKLPVTATVKNETVNRATTTQLEEKMYSLRIPVLERSTSTGLYTLRLNSLPTGVSDLIKEQGITLTVLIYDAAKNVVSTQKITPDTLRRDFAIQGNPAASYDVLTPTAFNYKLPTGEPFVRSNVTTVQQKP